MCYIVDINPFFQIHDSISFSSRTNKFVTQRPFAFIPIMKINEITIWKVAHQTDRHELYSRYQSYWSKFMVLSHLAAKKMNIFPYKPQKAVYL